MFGRYLIPSGQPIRAWSFIYGKYYQPQSVALFIRQTVIGYYFMIVGEIHACVWSWLRLFFEPDLQTPL